MYTHKKFDKKTHKKFDKKTHKKFDKKTHKKFDKKTHKKIHKKTHKKFDKKTNKKFDKKTNKKFDKKTHKKTHKTYIFKKRYNGWDKQKREYDSPKPGKKSKTNTPLFGPNGTPFEDWVTRSKRIEYANPRVGPDETPLNGQNQTQLFGPDGTPLDGQNGRPLEEHAIPRDLTTTFNNIK